MLRTNKGFPSNLQGVPDAARKDKGQYADEKKSFTSLHVQTFLRENYSEVASSSDTPEAALSAAIER
jgi:hypothetical protein